MRFPSFPSSDRLRSNILQRLGCGFKVFHVASLGNLFRFRSPTFGKDIVLRFRPEPGVFLAHSPGSLQYRQFRIAEKLVKKTGPVGHLDVLSALGAKLGLVEKHDHDTVESVDLLLLR